MLYEICCTIIFALSFPVLLKYILHLWKCRNMPPGPVPLPLIGNFHMVSHKPLHLVLTNLCQKYGNVFSISLGMGRLVIINDIDTTIKTLTLKSFSGRPSNRHFVFLYSRGYMNIVSADYGDDWRKRRKTAQGALRMVSDEHGNTESKIIQESQALHERLRSKAGFPISVRKQFGKAFLFSFALLSLLLKGFSIAVHHFNVFPYIKCKLSGEINK